MTSLKSTIKIVPEYRPCVVNGKVKAIFHKWSEVAQIVPPSIMKGGHQGGVVRGIMAIVEDESGEIHQVEIHQVRFLDSESLFSQYDFSE